MAAQDRNDGSTTVLVTETGEEIPVDYEAIIGAAALTLVATGDLQAAALLRDIRGFWYVDGGWQERHGETWRSVRPVFLVDAVTVQRYRDDDIMLHVRDALQAADGASDRGLSQVLVVPVAPPGDWRANLDAALLAAADGDVIDIGVASAPRRDPFEFGDGAERLVFEGIERLQAELPADNTIMAAPNAAVRLPNGRNMRLDFLLTYQRRVCGIEVDGSTHHRKYASDKSRDQLLEDAGMAFVMRIDAEDTNDPATVDRFLSRVLKKLSAP